MAGSRPLLLAALLALLVAAAGADAVAPPEQRAVRVVLYPVKLVGERVPPRPRLEVRARARGAGVTSVLVDQGGVVARVDADAVPGLVAGLRGAGLVRAPLVPGAGAATVSLVDAAGNVSPPAVVSVGALPRRPAATGTTDPAFAGFFWRLSAIGSPEPYAILPIGPGGAFSGTWTPPGPGVYEVVAEVPVERAATGFEVREQLLTGFVRG